MPFINKIPEEYLDMLRNKASKSGLKHKYAAILLDNRYNIMGIGFNHMRRTVGKQKSCILRN